MILPSDAVKELQKTAWSYLTLITVYVCGEARFLIIYNSSFIYKKGQFD